LAGTGARRDAGLAGADIFFALIASPARVRRPLIAFTRGVCGVDEPVAVLVEPVTITDLRRKRVHLVKAEGIPLTVTTARLGARVANAHTLRSRGPVVARLRLILVASTRLHIIFVRVTVAVLIKPVAVADLFGSGDRLASAEQLPVPVVAAGLEATVTVTDVLRACGSRVARARLSAVALADGSISLVCQAVAVLVVPVAVTDFDGCGKYLPLAGPPLP
jgi:hypothetical protein